MIFINRSIWLYQHRFFLGGRGQQQQLTFLLTCQVVVALGVTQACTCLRFTLAVSCVQNTVLLDKFSCLTSSPPLNFFLYISSSQGSLCGTPCLKWQLLLSPCTSKFPRAVASLSVTYAYYLLSLSPPECYQLRALTIHYFKCLMGTQQTFVE